MAIRNRYAKGVSKEPAFKSKLERAYWVYLGARKSRGELRDFRYEALKVRLADGAWFTCDFMVMANDDVLELHETKGFMREAAHVRLKVAAEQFPFRFFLVKKSRDGFDLTQY